LTETTTILPQRKKPSGVRNIRKTIQVNKSDKGNLYAKCTVCIADFNISHGGENDIKNISILLNTTKPVPVQNHQ
jgi:hypothetical protein